MSKEKLHLLEVEVNDEGNQLAYLYPLDEDGDTDCGYRIAGPKAWGGSRSLAKLKITDSDLATYINMYAPHIKEMLE